MLLQTLFMQYRYYHVSAAGAGLPDGAGAAAGHKHLGAALGQVRTTYLHAIHCMMLCTLDMYQHGRGVVCAIVMYTIKLSPVSSACSAHMQT